VVACAAALLLTAATGAFATKSPATKSPATKSKPGPFGYPLGADLSSVLALPSPPKAREEVFYSHGGDGPEGGLGNDIFAATTAGSPAILIPEDLASLDELPTGSMFMFKFRDSKDGPVTGYGVEQEMFVLNEAGEWDGGARPSDWIIHFPGRGALWLNANEGGGNIPDFTRPDGSVVSHTTSGPLKNGRGVIVGGSGEFTNRTGTFYEYDIVEPDGSFEVELHIVWDQKPKPRK